MTFKVADLLTSSTNLTSICLSWNDGPKHWASAICALYFFQHLPTYLEITVGNRGYRRHIDDGNEGKSDSSVPGA